MSARWGLLCVALLASAQAAFVQDGALMADSTLSGWGQPGTYALADGEDGEEGHRDLVRFWLAWMTQDGGTEAPSPQNPLTALALRIDHAGDSPDTENWNLQLNLGDAGPGKVDHVLQVRPAGAAAAQVRLSQYHTPYPAIGAFTTIGVHHVFSNDPESKIHLPGVEARSGTWAAGKYGLEVLLPIDWLAQAPASHVAADGSGTSLVWGTVFGSTGAFGVVGAVKDKLDDGTLLVVNTDTSTGSTTAQPISASRLAFLDAPSDGTAGTQLPDLRLEVRDAEGARVTNATHEIQVLIGSDPSEGAAVLSGTLRVRAVGGVATFTDLSIDTAGSPYTLYAVAAHVAPAESAPFDVVAPPSVTVDELPVDDAGAPQESRWGGWAADPGATGVLSNYLKVTNTGPVDAATFTLSFSAPQMFGAMDPAWSIGLRDNIRFACAETLDGEPPSRLAFTMGPPSATASTTCTFSTGSADAVGVIYVQYELLALPMVLPDQDYSAAFTVEVS